MKIEDIQILREKTTPGYWYSSNDGCIYSGGTPNENGDCDDIRIADMSCDGTMADRRFIVKTHNLIPLLLDIVEAAQNLSEEPDDEVHRNRLNTVLKELEKYK